MIRSMTAALLSLIAVCAPQLALADTHGIVSAAQISRVKKVPIPIYLPASLPAGFELGDFQVNDMAAKPNPLGWGYRLDAKSKAGATLEIQETTSGGGGGDADYKGYRRPFTVASAIGTVTFQPQNDTAHGWCYTGSTYIAHAQTPPVGSPPGFQMTACHMERNEVLRVFNSLQLVKAQTPYPKV